MWTFPFQNHPNGWLICWWGRPFVGLLFEPSVGYRPNYWLIIGRSRPPDDKIENCPATSGQCVCAACRHTVYLCVCLYVYLCFCVVYFNHSCLRTCAHVLWCVHSHYWSIAKWVLELLRSEPIRVFVLCISIICVCVPVHVCCGVCTPIGPLQSGFSNWGQFAYTCIFVVCFNNSCLRTCAQCARVHVCCALPLVHCKVGSLTEVSLPIRVFLLCVSIIRVCVLVLNVHVCTCAVHSHWSIAKWVLQLLRSEPEAAIRISGSFRSDLNCWYQKQGSELLISETRISEPDLRDRDVKNNILNNSIYERFTF